MPLFLFFAQIDQSVCLSNFSILSCQKMHVHGAVRADLHYMARIRPIASGAMYYARIAVMRQLFSL